MNKLAYERLMGLTLCKTAGLIDDMKNNVRDMRHKQVNEWDPGLGDLGNKHLRSRAHRAIDKQHDGTYTADDRKDDHWLAHHVMSDPLAEGSLKREIIERAPVYGASMLAGGTLGSTIAGEGNRLTGFGVGSATAALLTLLGRKLYYGKSISW